MLCFYGINITTELSCFGLIFSDTRRSCVALVSRKRAINVHTIDLEEASKKVSTFKAN